MTWLVVTAGLGQLALALGSLAIPRVLKLKEDTRKLKNLTRQLFWTYAGYIWATNVSFGLLSALAPETLLDGTVLARSVCGFIATYWGARLLIQFTYFDRSEAPAGLQYKVAEAALVLLFTFLTVLYGTLAVGLP